VDAAVVMGRIRFTLRAYLLEGHPPQVALGMASRDLDIVRDGHLVTVLIGVGDPVSRRVVLASAGHLSPLVAAEAGTEFVAVTPGPPLGVGFTEYRPTEVDVEPGALLLAFTDGLVERRGEDIDAGLGRLLAGVRRPAGPLQEWLTTMLPGQLGGQPAADDIAVLAIRWAVTSTAAAEPATFAAPLRN
jgi:serine phosphatase RsbU (regulator of sigma subunit)